MARQVAPTNSQINRWTDPGWLLLWAVRAGVLLVLLTPLIVSVDTLFPFVVGRALFARSVIEVTFALWLILVIYYPQRRPPRSWVLAALVVWLLVSLIASFAGVSLVRSLWSTYERMQGVIDLAHWVGFALVAGSVFRTFSDWRTLFTINLGLCGLVSALGLAQHYGLLQEVWLGTRSPDRIESTLGNATYLGAYTLVSAIIGVGMLVHSFQTMASRDRASQPAGRRGPGPTQQRSRSRSGRRRMARREGLRFDYTMWLMGLRAFWALAVVLSLWALWLTGTRGAIIGLGAGAVAFAIGYIIWGTLGAGRWASYGILAVAIVILLLVVVARTTPVLDPVINSNTMLERLNSIGTDDGSISGRIESVRVGLRAYLDKPLLGWGPQNYLIAWGRHFDAESGVRKQFDQAHSKPVEELTTTGAIGLLSYMLVWLAMAWAIIRSVRRRQGYDQLFVLALGATLTAYFVQNLFLFDTPATMMQFAFLVAFAVSEEGWARSHDRQAGQDGGRRWPGIGIPGIPKMPEGWRPRLGLGRVSSYLRTPLGGTLMVAVLAALAIGSLVLFNFRAYSGAETVATAMDSSIAWAERADYFDRSVDSFPPLANYPRIYLIIESRKAMNDLTDEEFRQAVDLVTREGQRGLEAEPENWRLHIFLARFYQVASGRDPGYLEVARVHVDELSRLAPRTHDAIGVKKDQERIEAQLLGP